jgi:hypothetical protein
VFTKSREINKVRRKSGKLQKALDVF